MRPRIVAIAAAGWAARAELLTAIAFLAGWLLLTSAIAALTSPLAWRFSIGLLALSLVGFRFISVVVAEGLYHLTREPKRARRG